MASETVEDDPNYKQLKEERDFFERKYLQLKKEYEEHLASCKDTSDDDPVDFEPPAKIQRLIPSTDPFVALDPELVDIILTYLTPKELLTAMEVSMTWKIFIESRESRMKRIMNNVVVNFKSEQIGGMAKKELEAILANKRGYKHMKADFALQFDFFTFPFIHFASTLESLEIICKLLKFEKVPESVNFPTLTKLLIVSDGSELDDVFSPNSLMNFIKASSFPEVTHLKIFEFNEDEIDRLLNQFMEKFPKLKVLHTKYDDSGYFGAWDQYVRYTKFENQPKIEALRVYWSYQSLLIGFKDTLTEVCIKEIIEPYGILEWLAPLERLQVLTIESLNFIYLPHVIIQNKSLKELTVWNFWYQEDEITEEEKENFHRFLRALPALQTLRVPAIYNELITFLASHGKSQEIDLHSSVRARGDGFVFGTQGT